MNLRRLNDDGIRDFSAYLTQLKIEPSLQSPTFLLQDETRSAAVAEVAVPEARFATRFDAAMALDALLIAAALNSPERDAGLWAWLALFYFDQLCPLKGGVRTVGEHARYIPNRDYKRFYRHLLIGPFLIYRSHSDEPQRSMGVLATVLSAPGDIVEQFASRQELISNHAVMAAVTSLYVDPTSRGLKRGSGGKGNGSPRRLADLLNQFDVTYDLYAVGARKLLSLLPKEFDRFKPA